VLYQIDVKKAARGWRNTLSMRVNNRRWGAKAQVREVPAFLVHHALARGDAIGDLARALRRKFPRHSVPLAETLEAIHSSELAAAIARPEGERATN
jgi:hypothetical protein